MNIPVLIVGAVFLLAGLFLTYHSFSKQRRCVEPVQAKIKGINERWDNNAEHPQMIYTPVFEYQYNGYNYVKSYDLGGSDCKYHVGDDVEIKIDPNKPEDFTIANGKGPVLFGLIFVAIGIVVVLIGCGVIFN